MPKPKQDLDAKKAEIQFRNELATQHRDGTVLFADEPDAEEINQIMSERIERTKKLMQSVVGQGIALSPFIEIGAERCQRSLVLENEFDCEGIAADISLDSMLFAEDIAKQFDYKKIPLRVCCDANNLPVRKGAIQFAFCFQTLHHFSDPKVVVDEIARVLNSSGSFYFDEEPVRMRGRVALYRRGNKPVNSLEKVLTKLKLIDFISDTGRAEVEAGVTELDFTISEWADILGAFDYSEVKVNSRKLHNQFLKELSSSSGPKRWWVEFMGANIYGLCRPESGKTDELILKPIESIICPQCNADGKQSSLIMENDSFECNDCGTEYRNVDGVHLVFTREMGKALYPDYF